MADRPWTEMVAQANAAAKQPVLFIHGLWLKPSSWDRWAMDFDEAGYVALAPAWPSDLGGDPAADKIGALGHHFGRIAQALTSRPAIIGHSFGGLIAQILAGRGLSAATVAIAPAPFRGVTPLPVSALRAAWPVLRSPANARGAVALTKAQFGYAFGNALEAAQSAALFEAYAAPAPGAPIFQAAAANLNPWTEARVDTLAPERGPLLMMAAERDHTVPPVVVRAALTLQKRNRAALTEFTELPGRGHSLTIDAGWRDPAEAALNFIQRFV